MAGPTGRTAMSKNKAALLFSAFAACIILAACGSSGVNTQHLANTPMAANQARLKITRTNALLYAGAPTTLTLNGKKVGDLAAGGNMYVDVPAGQNVLAASAWSYPGEFKVRFDAKPGTLYGVEVSPRTASFGPSTLLGPLGGVLDASVNENTHSDRRAASNASFTPNVHARREPAVQNKKAFQTSFVQLRFVDAKQAGT